MRRIKVIHLFFAVIIFMMFFSFVYGDDHLVYEESRSYMGHHSPKTTRETWLTENKACIRYRRFMSIIRLDLKKKWSVYPGFKAYLEEPLDLQAKEEKKSIYDIGWDYTPQYDWTVKETGESQQINGWECKKIIVHGEADYAELTIVMWLSKDGPINSERYHTMIQTASEERREILTAFPALKDFIVVEAKYTIQRPISPPITREVKMVKAEVADPPPNIYQIPPGLEKVNSLMELYGRNK